MSATINQPPKKLSESQVMLLHLFNLDMDETKTDELRQVLLDFLDKQLQIEIEKAMVIRGKTIDNINNFQFENRTEYLKK